MHLQLDAISQLPLNFRRIVALLTYKFCMHLLAKSKQPDILTLSRDISFLTETLALDNLGVHCRVHVSFWDEEYSRPFGGWCSSPVYTLVTHHEAVELLRRLHTHLHIESVLAGTEDPTDSETGGGASTMAGRIK